MAILTGLLVVLAGALNMIQGGLNGTLSKTTQAPLLAALMVLAGNLVVYAVAAPFIGLPWVPAERMGQVPWWAWCGGLLGGCYVLSVIFFAQKLGAATFTGLTVTAGIVTSVILDHYGWAGFDQHSASLWRILGCVAMIGGLFAVCAF